MERRQVLAVLGALVSAGCLGAKRPQRSSSVQVGGSTSQGTFRPTATATPTATPTPEPTPEETETPEPTPEPKAVEAEVEAALSRVQTSLSAVVEAYAGEDADLTAVDATSGSFDDRAVFLALDEVQRELVTAEATAVTDEQQAAVADLRTAERFLTWATAAQSYLIDTVAELRGLHAAFTEGRDEGEAAETRYDTALKQASSAVSTLKNDVEPDGLDAAAAFDGDTYEEKVSQFEAERATLTETSQALDRVVKGMEELEEAYEEEDDGNDEEAAEKADEAGDLFQAAYERLDEAAADAPADELMSLVDELYQFADDKFIEAGDLYNRTVS